MITSANLSLAVENCRVPGRVGYVLKRYPRFSETFVVNEILAHEAIGLDIDIFALRPTVDTHFQHAIGDVRASVTYLNSNTLRASHLWEEISCYAQLNPKIWSILPLLSSCDVMDICQGIQLAKLVLSRGIGHLHAHFATSASSVARVASLLTDVPYSVTAHAKDIFHEEVNEEELGRKLADAAAIVTVSNFNATNLERRFPQQARRIYRIYNGLPLEKYPYRDPRDRMPKLVAVGRLVEKKGFSDLVTACSLLRHSGTRFTCEIIGEGDFEECLRDQIHELGLEGVVSLLGALPQREVHQIMQEASLFVAPCVTATTGDRDGLPTVILEAMALGTPCLATNVTGISEVVRHLETGIILPERQPQLLADAIAKYISDPQLGVRMARAARELMQNQFDASENTAQLRQIFSICRSDVIDRNNIQPTLAEVG